MRIAIDARPLASPLTGIGRYTDSLVRRLVQSDDHEWFLYSDRPLATALPARDNVTVRIGNARSGSPGSLRWAQWEYVRWAKQDRIETFWSPRHHLPLLLPKRIKKVVTIHDFVWKRYPETMQRKNYWLEKLLMPPSIRIADQVICVSRFTQTELVAFFPESNHKAKVILEAAEKLPGKSDLSAFIPKDYLLFVGTLEPRKNLNRLIEAYANIKDQGVPELIIVGGQGWGGISLDDLVIQHELERHVILLGYVDDPALHTLYRNAYCLLMPSLYEGFGLPVAEAMQFGTPCIVTEESALSEIGGTACVTIKPDSVPDIERAILSIVANPELHQRLSNNAILEAQKLSWEQCTEATLEILGG